MGKVKELYTARQTISDGIGYVYCLSNPAMPGLVKIGFTNRTTAIRANELFSGSADGSATGVPLPFQIVKDWRVPSNKSKEIEQHIHHKLSAKRVSAKEFFCLEPDAAIREIESILFELDWWHVAQASELEYKSELQARDNRKKLESDLKVRLAQRDSDLEIKIHSACEAWKSSARRLKESDGTTAGMKWGAIWGFGSFIFFASLGAKDAVGWLCLALGIFAYYMSKAGPANEYLNSEAARAELKRIEDSVRSEDSRQPLTLPCPSCATTLRIAGRPTSPDYSVKCPSCRTEFYWMSFKRLPQATYAEPPKPTSVAYNPPTPEEPIHELPESLQPKEERSTIKCRKCGSQFIAIHHPLDNVKRYKCHCTSSKGAYRMT